MFIIYCLNITHTLAAPTCVVRKLWHNGQWTTLARWRPGRHACRWHINCMCCFKRFAGLCDNTLQYNATVQVHQP